MKKFKLPLIALLTLTLAHSFNTDAQICSNVGGNPMWGMIKSELERELPTCRPKNIALTFDDGPSITVTPSILSDLKKRNIKATFFITTTKLDPRHSDGGGLVSAHSELIKREMREGHLIADHGYEHDSYDLRIEKGVPQPGYSNSERSTQINKSVQLLNQATVGAFGKQSFKLFRFPYGRGAMPSPAELAIMEKQGKVSFESKSYSDNFERNVDRLNQYRKQSPALASLSQAGFDHLGWNFDSQDFKYSIAISDDESVREYVKKSLANMCESYEKTQVALFHDIKPINAKAVPLIIDIGRCMGLNFISPQEMMAAREKLENRGVLIAKDFQMKAVAGYIGPRNKTFQSIDELLCPTCETQGMPKAAAPVKKKCLSENGRSYSHCEGEDSICYDGEWFSRKTAIENQMCNLKTTSMVETEKTCKSSNGRIYRQCEGEDSICFNGGWTSRVTAIEKNICKF